MPYKTIEINSLKNRLRNRTILGCLVLIVIFSSYFMSTFFLQNITYTAIPLLLDTLDVIYFRDACSQMVIADVRESVVLN